MCVGLELWKKKLGACFQPGQGLMLQSVVSILCPRQLTPPLAGAGLLHDRVRVLPPEPQEALQLLHTPHGLQLPFTGRAGRIDKVSMLKLTKYV